jgi:tetraacyldisaccharide 4'-kinase
VLYQGIMACRNWAFNSGLLRQKTFTKPVLAIGNLSTGGTGKTPMTEFLLSHFKNSNPGVISRGYGRKSKGCLPVKPDGQASQYGDEPLQIAQNFKEASVWVSEKRALGIEQALHQQTNLNWLILDDAFQHRYVKAGFYILLSTYQKPFYKDWVLPAGNLRESRRGAKRAHAVIITKCPSELSAQSKNRITQRVRRYSNAPIYFSFLKYEPPTSPAYKVLSKGKPVLLLSGIANPAPLVQQVKNNYLLQKHLSYPDHYRFKPEDIVHLQQLLKENNWALVTTQKDWVRLASLLPAALRKRTFIIKVNMAFSPPQEKTLLMQLQSFIKRGGN